MIFIHCWVWVKDLGQEKGGKRGWEGGRNGNQMLKAEGGCLLCYCIASLCFPSAPPKVCHFFWSPSVLHTERKRERHTQFWLCFFPLAYLVKWPWKTKQVLSTFDFSAFKLILSAQLLKQLSSPAVSNFRLGTFTGCQVLSLHCESLSLSKRYSNNLYFFLRGTCTAVFLYQFVFIIYLK